MDNEAVDFKTALAAWAERERLGSGQHPSVEDLSAYRAGRLSPEERERLADHVALCRRCFDLLPDVEAFRAAAADREDAPADFEAAAFWRTLRPRLDELRNAETAPADERRRAAARQPRWGVPAALAASLLAAVLGWTSWSQHQTIAAMRSPRPNAGIYDLFEDTSVRSGTSSQQSITARAGVLILNLRDAGSYAEYHVRIADDQDQEVWSGSGFRKDPDDGTFTLWLPPGFLAPGDYHVRLSGLRNQERELLEEYVVQVRP